jgi:hypothetical protein
MTRYLFQPLPNLNDVAPDKARFKDYKDLNWRKQHTNFIYQLIDKNPDCNYIVISEHNGTSYIDKFLIQPLQSRKSFRRTYL